MLKPLKFISQLKEVEQRWFAVYTKYKCEKYVVEKLKAKGITAYTPLISKVKQYSRKTKEYRIPLINCYVFVKIQKSEYLKVLETEYVKGFLKQRKDLIAIPEEEIAMLQRVVGEIEDIHSSPLDFESGMEVEVISGNLTGIRGKLISKQGKTTFVVLLNTIGYQLTMTIDASLLNPIKRIIEV